MGLFANLGGGEETGRPSPSDPARARRLTGLLDVWRGRGLTGAVLLGAAAWMLAAPLIAAYMLIVSLWRLIRAVGWIHKARLRARDPRVVKVLGATLVAIAAEATLLALLAPHLGSDARRLPLPSAAFASLVPWLWIGLNTLGAKLDKALGIPPLVGALERDVVEESAQSLLRRDRRWRLLGEPGDTRPNMALVFLFWTAFGAGLGSTGFPLFSLPHTGVRAVVDLIDDTPEDPPVEPQSTPGDVPTEDVDETVPAPPGTSVSPSETAAEVTALDICGYWPETTFAEDDDVPEGIASRLSDAYYQIGGGAREVGCPDAGVEVQGDLYTSILTHEQSGASLIVIAAQEDAVVFHQLYLYAWRLLKRDKLGWVETKKSTGLGDYQVFHLTDQSCVLAIRNRYKDKSFVVLPSIVSHAVMQAAILNNEFPEVYEKDPAPSIVGRGRFTIEWHPPSGDVERLVVTKRNATKVLGGRVDKVVDPGVCPDVGAFDLVAADALRRWEEAAG